MFQFAVGLAVGLFLWGMKELVAAIRKPRLQICAARGDSLRERPVSADPRHVETVRDVVLTVRNVGGRPAVDCTAWVENVGAYRDGAWQREASRPAAALEWEGTGDSQRATIHPTPGAPGRRLRILSLVDHPGGPQRAYFAYADPDEYKTYPYTAPLHIQATVWIQPEDEDGDPASCQVEVEWTYTTDEGGNERQEINVTAAPPCDELPDRRLGLLWR